MQVDQWKAWIQLRSMTVGVLESYIEVYLQIDLERKCIWDSGYWKDNLKLTENFDGGREFQLGAEMFPAAETAQD